MHVVQKQWTEDFGWKDTLNTSVLLPEAAQIVFVFGARALLEQQKLFKEIKTFFPQAHIISCSTAGEIKRDEVCDNSIIATAVAFADTTLQFAETKITRREDSFKAGQYLGSCLPATDLVHVMVFSEGLTVNGSQLVEGLIQTVPQSVHITGGLVGDGEAFQKTLVGFDALPVSGLIVVVGFYGKKLRVGYGSLGGWDAFGLDRTITRSTGNILYELDGKPALSLYKTYLGEQAKDLPGSGLLFPLNLKLTVRGGETIEVVRTILAVDNETQSMTFAGDMPQGQTVRLMKANFERLIDGAASAANKSVESFKSVSPELAILISCIGRKLVLKERIDEEVLAVGEIVGEKCAVTGFYSYGEIAPGAAKENQCQLHNQTMTITTFREESDNHAFNS